MQATIYSNNQDMKSNKKDSDEKIIKLAEYFKVIPASTIVSIMYQIKI